MDETLTKILFAIGGVLVIGGGFLYAIAKMTGLGMTLAVIGIIILAGNHFLSQY